MNASNGKPVVIIGGGVAGLRVAQVLAANGLECVIVEQDAALGGKVRQWACMATGRCLRCFCCSVEDLLDEVEASPRVRILRGAKLVSFVKKNGTIAQAGVQDTASGNRQTLSAAALVVATGFEPYDPTEKVFWGYGRLPGVVTLREMNSLLRDDRLTDIPDGIDGSPRLAFFQCVGSRDVGIGADYCSQYCCSAALRAALRIKAERREWEITLFYIDLQIAGKLAGFLLEEAERKGIRLCQGVPGEITEGPDGTLEVIREEAGRNRRESFHRIVLSIGQKPSASAAVVGRIAGIERDDFGFFKPRGCLDAGRTSMDRVYLAGTCSGPKDIEETLVHAGQAAAAILADLGAHSGGRP